MFRDQEFTSDMKSRSVKRIGEVPSIGGVFGRCDHIGWYMFGDVTILSGVPIGQCDHAEWCIFGDMIILLWMIPGRGEPN